MLAWNVFLQRTLYLPRFAVGHHAKRDYLDKWGPKGWQAENVKGVQDTSKIRGREERPT